MAGFRTDSMRHVGMNRVAIKEAIKSKLIIGQQYRYKSGRDCTEDKRYNNFTSCKLLSFGRNVAVFEESDGRIETLTYQDIWKMLLEGSFR